MTIHRTIMTTHSVNTLGETMSQVWNGVRNVMQGVMKGLKRMTDHNKAEEIKAEQENCNKREPTWKMCLNCDYGECRERVDPPSGHDRFMMRNLS